jgi:hypothetical protein
VQDAAGPFASLALDQVGRCPADGRASKAVLKLIPNRAAMSVRLSLRPGIEQLEDLDPPVVGEAAYNAFQQLEVPGHIRSPLRVCSARPRAGAPGECATVRRAIARRRAAGPRTAAADQRSLSPTPPAHVFNLLMFSCS